MAASPHVFNADEANFQSAVLDRSKKVPVVIDFWAPWCGPCRALAPMLERLVDARNGEVVLAKVNVDENPELAAAFHIQSIPAVMAIRDGKLIDQFEGALPEPMLEEFLNRLVPSPIDREVQQARELESSKPEEAAKIYARVLDKEPRHVGALLGTARLRLAAREFDEVNWLLEKVPPGGEEGAEAERISALVALKRFQGQEEELRKRVEADAENPQLHMELGQALAAAERYPEALAELYFAAERDRELARGPVKELMVRIFHVVGQRSELAEEYRDKLRRVMY